MKNQILIIGLIAGVNLNAQDVIRTQNGNDIKVVITKNTPDTLIYKEYNNSEGPLYIIPKSELMEIRYQNGSIELSSFSESEEDKIKKMSDKELYQKGYEDGKILYKPQGWGALAAATELLDIYVPGRLINENTKVNFDRQAVSSRAFLDYTSYKEGYQAAAAEKREKREITTIVGGTAAALVAAGVYVLIVPGTLGSR